MIKTDGIILDIDGTIWNTTPVVAQAWNKAILSTYPQVPTVTADILKTQFGKTMDVIADNLFSILNETQKKDLLNKCCSYEQKALAQNEKDITYPNVVKTIREISKKIPLFIVSNCQNGYIELTMDKLEIRTCISDWECFGHSGLSKAENISLIVQRNKLKNPVYVGDTEGDFLSCKEAGVPFIWAEYGFGKNLENFDIADKITDFSELPSKISNS